MNHVVVWHRDRFVGASTISVEDHGLLIGDGTFDTIGVHDGRPGHLDRHLRRLRAGTDRLGIGPLPDDRSIISAIETLISDHRLSRARVRITVTPGAGPTIGRRGEDPTVIISIGPMAPAPTSVSLTTTDWVRNERSPLAGIKSTSWSDNAQILRTVRADGFDEAVLCDSTGRVSECCAANLFIVRGGLISTPSSETGCLPGIIREVLLDCGAAIEQDLTIAELAGAEELFLTSSTNLVVGVSSLDGRPLHHEGPGTRTARAAVAEAG